MAPDRIIALVEGADWGPSKGYTKPYICVNELM
jgi:hypothetical protein